MRLRVGHPRPHVRDSTRSPRGFIFARPILSLPRPMKILPSRGRPPNPSGIPRRHGGSPGRPAPGPCPGPARPQFLWGVRDASAVGLDVDLPDESKVQGRRDHVTHLHGVPFRLVGECFHAPPSLRVVVASGYNPRRGLRRLPAPARLDGGRDPPPDRATCRGRSASTMVGYFDVDRYRLPSRDNPG